MDNSGNIKRMMDLTEEELKKYKPIQDEFQASAEMILKGDKKGKVDPAVFKSWTAKRKRKHLQQKMSRKKNR